ncbi:hypothetical protein [Cerasicoccus fimbriatus]|uniref:hypothetical protein n=1 Tax=Cerasicoccus fimbriatus TaxID=3014554 RepID=UPI0022B4A3D4|nr:hypothetical protein [Cerasicoccus sp. TK19100]
MIQLIGLIIAVLGIVICLYVIMRAAALPEESGAIAKGFSVIVALAAIAAIPFIGFCGWLLIAQDFAEATKAF